MSKEDKQPKTIHPEAQAELEKWKAKGPEALERRFAELLDAVRWRMFSDEMPPREQMVQVFYGGYLMCGHVINEDDMMIFVPSVTAKPTKKSFNVNGIVVNHRANRRLIAWRYYANGVNRIEIN